MIVLVGPKELQQAAKLLIHANVLGLEGDIVNLVIQMKQEKKIKLPDAIIAATAIHQSLTLVTKNSKDFERVAEVTVYNPFPK